MDASITYTRTDESPRLASASLLPIFQSFVGPAQVQIEEKDISLAGRVLALFYGPEGTASRDNNIPQVPDALADLALQVQQSNAAIMKLPNISASIPQLEACIRELQVTYDKLPDYSQAPDKYAKVLGSAVNPVLRQGNSDRRAAAAVKTYARQNPHKMSPWPKNSKTHVAHMQGGDFYANEKALQLDNPTELQIKFIPQQGEAQQGEAQVLKQGVQVGQGDIVDASFMSLRELKKFFSTEMAQAKQQDLLLSLHLKATMMKVSDPIIFGEAVKVYFKTVFEQCAAELKDLNFNPRNGVKELDDKLQTTPNSTLQQAVKQCYVQGPRLAMTDSDRGLTHLHIPSDVIIDASMPAMIRAGGQLWGPDGKTYDSKALIPDRSYAGVYQEAIEFCKKNGAFDVSTMGHVSNVGLMAQKAQEYGSHDKTFQIPSAGRVQVVNSKAEVLLEHVVGAGDIWRMCVTRHAAIDNWLQLACSKATPKKQVLFWLDDKRAHDKLLIQRVQVELKKQNLNACIMAPAPATAHTMQRTKEGLDTVSATGNVLRDYLTDLFPILELGTSSKMLSIVPLLKGGRLFEPGAGGSAPRHVDQLLKENHLRWDSLGEFLAMAEALMFVGKKKANVRACVLAQALSEANKQYLQNNKTPQRGVKSLDTRGSHFYLAYYWAQALARQSENQALHTRFKTIAKNIEARKDRILQELTETQGQPVDLGGYYHPCDKKLASVMRPSPTFNQICVSI